MGVLHLAGPWCSVAVTQSCQRLPWELLLADHFPVSCRSFPLYLTLCPQPANLLLDGSLARGLQDYLGSSGQEP